MANPQPEEFTRISNELLEALCRVRVAGEAMQCFLVILRKTYGFNKKSDKIALSTFGKLTGMPRPTCLRALNKLISMNIIAANKESNITSYSINKDYESWKVLSKKITPSVIKNDNTCNDKLLSKMITPVIKNDNKSVIKNDNIKRKKETITKESIKERELSFKYSLSNFVRDYPEKMLTEFFEYWSEPNKSGSKLRFEMEKTWDLNRRLKRWANNNKNWSKDNGYHKHLTEDKIRQIASDLDSEFRE